MFLIRLHRHVIVVLFVLYVILANNRWLHLPGSLRCIIVISCTTVNDRKLGV